MTPLTGSFNKVDGYGGAYDYERDPQGANTGTEDPWLYYEEPVFHNIGGDLPLIEGGGNPFNPTGGCQLDGIDWDCNDIARRAENGSVVGGVYHNGHYLGQVSLSGGLSGSGSVSFFMGDPHTDVTILGEGEFGDNVPQSTGPGGSWMTVNYSWNLNIQPYTRSFQQTLTPPKTSFLLSTSQLDAIEKQLKEVMSKEECSSFMKAFLGEISRISNRSTYGTEVMGIFKRIRTDRGQYGVRGTNEKTGAIAWGGGVAGNSTGLVIIDMNMTSLSGSIFIPALIHEIVHAAAGGPFPKGDAQGFSHGRMDLAAYNVLKGMGKAGGSFSGKTSYFANYLEEHCKHDSLTSPL